MRQKFTPQMTLFAPMARNSIVKELEQISKILDANPGLMDLVFQDLIRTSRPDTGRQGLTAEQVLRCAVLKQYRQLTYEELAFHLEDSDSFRSFSRLDMGQYPSKIYPPGEHQSYRGRNVGGNSSRDHGVCNAGENRDRPRGPGRLDGSANRHTPSHRLNPSV